ncbi:hypothetical protein ACFC09_15375 [Streptomyces sp. NPDC056161]|uniref:hypothetical protein n=1 Tax=Streptomyces sp. NPDC056161 TaxID=3345732 RepID=UPI0035DBD8C8
MASRLRDFLVSITPGNDHVKAAQLRQSAEERAPRQRAKEAAAGKKRARRHKRGLPPLG